MGIKANSVGQAQLKDARRRARGEGRTKQKAKGFPDRLHLALTRSSKVFQSTAEQEPQLEIHYSLFISKTARKEEQKGGSKQVADYWYNFEK